MELLTCLVPGSISPRFRSNITVSAHHSIIFIIRNSDVASFWSLNSVYHWIFASSSFIFIFIVDDISLNIPIITSASFSSSTAWGQGARGHGRSSWALDLGPGGPGFRGLRAGAVGETKHDSNDEDTKLMKMTAREGCTFMCQLNYSPKIGLVSNCKDCFASKHLVISSLREG